jgi:hypothetical protein
MRERARKSPSTQEQFSQTRGYPPPLTLPRMTTEMQYFTSQSIWTRRHRYPLLKCSPRRRPLDDQRMALIPERRRVLGSYAHPRVRCPRSGSKRGGVGRCTEGAGGCVVGEGTHFSLSFPFSVLLNGCGRFCDFDKKSGLYWPWAP